MNDTPTPTPTQTPTCDLQQNWFLAKIVLFETLSIKCLFPCVDAGFIAANRVCFLFSYTRDETSRHWCLLSLGQTRRVQRSLLFENLLRCRGLPLNLIKFQQLKYFFFKILAAPEFSLGWPAKIRKVPWEFVYFDSVTRSCLFQGLKQLIHGISSHFGHKQNDL